MSNLLMKLKTSPSCSKRRCNEKISDGPSIEDEILKKNSDCTDTISKEAKINYQDELVLLFFNSMLDIIVSSWVSTQTVIGPTCVCKKVGTRKIEESFSSFTDGEAVNSDINDTKRSRSSATSVKSSVLDGKRDSIKRKLSKISELSISAESWSKQSKDTRPSFESKQSSDVVPDWILCVPDEKVIVKFKNGDYYEGATRRKLMHGYGKYTWSDGTVYEGDFVNGYASGHGVLRYSDLSIYHGEFCKSILNGYGEFNIAESTMKYCGMWKSGQKHGKGWMLYCPKSWYDGEWCEDQRHGKGLRYYEGGEKYQGDWCNGERHGNGIFVWNNNDIYKGKWVEGKINGYGEYTWNAFLNKTFTFPIENVYKGLWVNGVRHGTGILDFGFDNGAKVACVFENNCKHGAGILICGNGAIVQQSVLFWNDTPINILKTATSNRSESCNSYNANLSLQFKQRNGDGREYFSDVQVGGNILRIPIHAPPEETDFSYYIDFAIREYLGFLYKEQLNNIEPGQRLGKENTLDTPGAYIQQNNTTVSVERCPSTNTAEYNNMLAVFKLQQREVEKKHVRDALIYELPKLYKLYNKYATITSYQKVAFTPILIRYFFWQMIRDLNFLGTKYTLVDIDMIILENPNCGLEFDHHPFERIYFWQFLQILMTLAWKLHSPCIVVEDCKTYGALATIFHNFLAEAVYSYPEITHSLSLFEYRDLLPIESVYSLYKSIGEPHTARTFLINACSKKNEKLPDLHLLESEKIVIVPSGVNVVPVGGNIAYIGDGNLVISEPLITTTSIVSTNPFRKLLYPISKIGPNAVVKCLVNVCPQILENNVIVNMEYPLTFIEFFDTLLMCTVMVVEQNRKRDEKCRYSLRCMDSVELRTLDIHIDDNTARN